jgi:hypothetical protein
MKHAAPNICAETSINKRGVNWHVVDWKTEPSCILAITTFRHSVTNSITNCQQVLLQITGSIMLLFEPKTARETPAVKILLNKSSKKILTRRKTKVQVQTKLN